jgi:gamma-glutamyltranspeptidase/glutathione hydrolase
MAPTALESLISIERAATLASNIDSHRASPSTTSSTVAGGGTVYLATADQWGGVVSLIESNYGGFGSGLVDPQTGIAYQNRGAFFSLDPGHVNVIAPRKRTMHTLTPGMLLRDGRPWVVHGSMGGEIQPQIFAQTVSAIVDGGLDVATAVSMPRWAALMAAHAGPPSLTVIESRFPPSIAASLRSLGHDVTSGEAFDDRLGHAHAIELLWDGSAPDNAEASPIAFAAATDPRSEGAPATY